MLLRSLRTLKLSRLAVIKIFLALISLRLILSALALFRTVHTTELEGPVKRDAVLAPKIVSGETLSHGIVARAFKSRELPCLKPDAAMKTKNGFRAPATSGLLFMKLVKTGGSTAAGITMRIAKNTAERRKMDFWICRGRWDHGWAFKMLPNRQREKSFTWTIVREPTKRAVSEFFHFQVTRERRSSSDSSFQKFLVKENAKELRDVYLRVLSIEKHLTVFDSEAPGIISQILDDYDFIGVTERMDESVVALTMLLGVPLGDALFLNAKGGGNYDDGVHDNKCYMIKPSWVSDKMQAFFEEKYWKKVTKWDYLLYETANLSLDMTIDRLGRKKFADNLATFRKAQRIAKDRCNKNEIFPCTSNGEHNRNSSCLWSDSGCGYLCLDQIALELGIA